MLPFEGQNRREIQEQFKDYFDRSQRLLDLGVQLVQELAKTEAKTAPIVKAACVAIAYDALRRYRSIVILAELGYTENSNILSRSLFELVLAGRFVLGKFRKRKSTNQKKKSGIPQAPKRFDKQAFRAYLYALSSAIKLAGLVNEISTTKGRKRTFDKATRQLVAQSVNRIELFLGKQAASEIRKQGTYSGMTVFQLATACGLREEYVGAYKILCETSHAADAFQRLDINADRIALDRAKQHLIPSSLYRAGAYLQWILLDVAEEFELQGEDQIAAVYEGVVDAAK